MLFAPFSQRRIFMDYAAGSEPNPSSIHNSGVIERRKLESARKDVAKALAVQASEIIFTSGGTEANNLAILGIFRAAMRRNTQDSPLGPAEGSPVCSARPHIITSNVEHASVLEAVKQAEREGAEISYLHVKEDGVVDISKLEFLLKPETVLVSLMHANNETGTIQQVREVGQILQKLKTNRLSGGLPMRQKTPYYHVDACQTAGYRSIEPQAFFADLLTISGHKVYGPRGTGLLFVKNGTELEPLLFGGGQERGLRAGTENVEGQIAFAKAFIEVQKNKNEESKRLEELRTYLLSELSTLNTQDGLLRAPEDRLVCSYNSSKNHQLPNIVNVSFPSIESDRMVLELDAKGIAVSAGSACHAGSASWRTAYSQVIANMKGEDVAKSAIRFSLGSETSKKDIQIVMCAISDILRTKLTNRD